MAIKTVLVKGDGVGKEGVAGGAITPGHLVIRNSSNAIVVHGTAAANAAPSFARENEVVGMNIDAAYATNDQVLYTHCWPGAEVYALVAASAAAIVIGDYLESAGDGTLRVLTTDAATDDTQRASVVARAVEAVDNSGGGSPARILVEIV